MDDDVTSLTIGNNVLENYYNVVTLNSGKKLLNILQKKLPDLILLDIEMPELNGYQTITEIKNNPNFKEIPIIFLTAKNNIEDELKGLTLGAVDYILKPFSPSLMLKRIEVHLLIELQRNELLKFNTELQHLVKQKTRSIVDLQNAILQTFGEIVEHRDSITGSHIDRTQRYLRILFDEMIKSKEYKEELKDFNIELIIQSAPLHDVGKISISDNILNKPGKLTKEEFENMKMHTVFGEKIIENIKAKTSEHNFLEYARVLAIAHHEKWDGSGYPIGLKGKQIPFLGRVMAIADVYDALISERPYKKPLSHEQAVSIIAKDSESHFDPNIVCIFLKVHDKFKEIAFQY